MEDTDSELRVNAVRLTETAQRITTLCRLWLEHPAAAHQAHELAASAWELVCYPAKVEEHRKAAEYWAAKEAKRQPKRNQN